MITLLLVFDDEIEAQHYINALNHYEVDDWYQGSQNMVYIENPQNWELPMLSGKVMIQVKHEPQPS